MKKPMRIEKVFELAGGKATLARQLTNDNGEPLSRQAVDQWLHVPVKHVLNVEKITGISRHQLRPDIYPDD